MFLSNAALCQLKYPLPDAVLTAPQICGKEICDPGSVGKLLHLTRSPFSPEIASATTPQDVAAQVLGRTLPARRIKYSKDFNTCSATSSNPFTASDIEALRFKDGRTIEYTYKKRLALKVESALDATTDVLNKLTNDQDKIARIQAKIRAAYERVNGTELEVVGKYSEWGLSSATREKLKKGDGYQECRKYVQEKNQRIMLAIGMVYFEITYDQNSLDVLVAELDAELKKEGLTGSISFSFKKEVTKDFHAASELYQVLIVRHAGIDDDGFVELLGD